MEDTYGELAAMQYAIEVTQYNINVEPSIIESKALIGSAMAHSISPGMSSVKGSFTFEVNPHNIGLLLGLTLGSEAEPSLVSGITYKHVYTPITGGDSLKSMSIVADKKANVFAFVGVKVDKLKLEVAPDGYLLATVDIVGQREIAGASLAELTYAAILPFKFSNLSIKFGTSGSEASTPVGDFVKKLSPEYSNNLETNRYRADGNSYGSEIDYQQRSLTVSVECDYTDETDAYRESNYKIGTPISIQALYEHETEIESGKKYKIILDVLYGYITSAPVDVPGADRLAITFTLKATTGANGDVSITLQDDNPNSYTTGNFDNIMSGGIEMGGNA
jgi:hypothetical protein